MTSTRRAATGPRRCPIVARDRPRDERRVRSTGVERHEPRPVREARPRPPPRAGARAGSCRSRPVPVSVTRREASRSVARLGELALAADEASSAGRQVVGPRVERPDRREVRLEARRSRAGTMRSGRRSLRRCAPSVAERHAGGQGPPARSRRRPRTAAPGRRGRPTRPAPPGGRRGRRSRRPRRARPSPVWTPMRTRIAASAGPRLGGERPLRVDGRRDGAAAGSGRRRRTQSPSVPISTPPLAASAAADQRAVALEQRAASAASRAASTRRVDPSMSVNRNVTSPVGGWGDGHGWPRRAAPRSGGPW